MASVKTRIDKLEGAGAVHGPRYLGVIAAKRGETFEDAIRRRAAHYGLTMHEVGAACVAWFPDKRFPDERLKVKHVKYCDIDKRRLPGYVPYHLRLRAVIALQSGDSAALAKAMAEIAPFGLQRYATPYLRADR